MGFGNGLIRFIGMFAFFFAFIIIGSNVHRLQYATIEKNPSLTHAMLKIEKNMSLSNKLSEIISLHKAAHYFSENAEYTWRNSRFHYDIIDLANATRIGFSRNKVTYVYVHVPRTAGDSLQTHLFPIPKEQIHTGQVSWWGPTGVPDLKASLDPPMISNNYKRLYKNFWSRDRIYDVIKTATMEKRGTAFDKSKNKIKIFTILRHPHERIC